MDNNNVAILRVQLDPGKTEQELVKLTASIAETKKEQAALTKVRDTGRLTEAEYTKAVVDLQFKLKGQQTQQQDLTKSLGQYRMMMSSATGSVDQLKAQSALLTRQYNALSKEERVSTEAGKELTVQLLEVNEALKQAGKDVGDTRRNVGNYKEAILSAAKESGLFGGITGQLSEAQSKYAAGQKIVAFVTAETTGVTKALRIAFIALPIFAVVAVLAALYTSLTKTQAGMDFVERKTAAAGAVFNTLLKVVLPVGAAMLRLFTDPKQAASDFVDFLQTNVANRLRAFGVLVDAIRNRDTSKLQDGFIQLTTGITDGTAKAKAFVGELSNAATVQERLTTETQRIRAAERELNVARDESRAKIEGLKKLSDDSTVSVAARTAAATEAGVIENGLLAAQLKLQQDKIDNLQAEQRLKGNITNEDKNALAALQSERAKTEQESLTLQTELQNKLNSLVQEGIDKRIAQRAQALAAEAAQLNKQLAQVKTNTDEELALLQKKLRNGYEAELNTKNLTKNQKLAIDTKYEQDSLANTLDFNRRRLQAALQSALDTTTAELAVEQEGGEQVLRLQEQQIENQRRLALAALDANADNTAKINAINAQAEQQRRQIEYADAMRLLEIYLGQQRQAVELDYAKRLIQEGEYQRRLAGINKAGTDAQALINSDYRQSNAENQKQAASGEIETARRTAAETKRTEEVKQKIKAATLQSAANYTDTIISLFGAESEAGKAAMALKKVLALAEIGLNLQKVFALNATAAAQIAAFIPLPAGPILATAYKIAQDALAVTAAAAAAANILKLEKGGLAQVGGGLVAQGPAHAQGGIPLYHKGLPAGIEIEGNEPVLTANVSRSPLLLSMASAINQLAGGRALLPASQISRHMRFGGMTAPQIRETMAGPTAPAIDYARLGASVAEALRKQPPTMRWSDFKAAEGRANYTDSMSSF